ncbi:MetQ/NlpA family ABC transporter substrate-binding protein [Falsiroseomonas sp. HW251]|uniref:MetQ/NlpA family ABC transporter substrate-binding protein n=1 Tax=Falsiroseomonas sp. HW251 TaxID=3390998 RepID=UPI003D318917
MNRRHLLGFLGAAVAMPAMAQDRQIRIGFFPGPYADQFKRAIQPMLEREGYRVTVTELSNAIQPNTAVMDGALDANIFQNRAFMETFNERNRGDLREMLRIPSAPLGLYSRNITALDGIRNGMRVAVPNDPANMGRALAFLASLNLITLDPSVPATRATQRNITGNPRNLQIVPLDAPQMPRALPDVDAAAILGNHVIAAGMLLSSAIALEDPAPEYQIIIVAREGAANAPWLRDLLAAYRSPAFKEFIANDPRSRGFSTPDYWR